MYISIIGHYISRYVLHGDDCELRRNLNYPPICGLRRRIECGGRRAVEWRTVALADVLESTQTATGTFSGSVCRYAELSAFNVYYL